MQLRLVLEVMHTPQCWPNEGSWLGCTGWESCRSHHAGLRGRLYLCPCRPVLNVQVAGVLYYTTLRVLQWCCKTGGIIEFSMQRPSLYSAFPLNTSWLIRMFALICRYLFVHLQAHEARQGHSYCSQQGCERIKIMAQMYPGGSWSCAPNPFLQRPATPQRPVSQHQAVPCRACGAPQVRAPLLQHLRSCSMYASVGNSRLWIWPALCDMWREGFCIKFLQFSVPRFKDNLKEIAQLEAGECTVTASFFPPPFFFSFSFKQA